MSFQITERTEQEAAVAARQLLRKENIGTISSLYHVSNKAGKPIHHGPPRKHSSNCPALSEQVECNCMFEFQDEMEGTPFNLFDYYVDIPESKGDPIFFMSYIQKTTKNLLHNPKASFTVRASGHGNPMASSRFCLLGEVHLLDNDDNKEFVSKCREEFAKRHPDVKWWLDFEDFKFYRLQVKKIYWVGGFGNSHYIGNISLDMYQSAKESDLPAPKIGYKDETVLEFSKETIDIPNIKEERLSRLLTYKQGFYLSLLLLILILSLNYLS